MENFEELGSENTTFQQGSISGNGGGEPTLKEADRKKLDGIVQKMIQNKESDENIKFVVNDFKKKYGTSQPKGVTTEQNTASQSASVNGGSLSASGDVRPKTFTGERKGLVKKPKTFLQQVEEEQRTRPKVGETIVPKTKFDKKVEAEVKKQDKLAVQSATPVEKVKQGLTAPTVEKTEKEKIISQSEFEKERASNYNYKYDDYAFADISEQDLVKTSSIFKDVNKLNIDESDFARFLKNETNFYNDSYDIKRGRYENPDIEYNANKLEYLRAQSNNDSYLQAYLNDRVKFLKTKLLTAKDDVSKQKIANEISSIGKDYGKYRATLFPDLTKEEERIRTRNSQLYNRAKSGKGNALYQTKETVENFFSGVGAPIEDLTQTITEKLDETLKSFDINVLDTAVKKGRFKSYYDKWNNSDGFDGVYGSGKEVKFGKDTYIVTENGSVIDTDTGSSINSFTDKNTLDSIKALANETEKTGSYFSGVSLTRQIANTAGQIIPQVLATKGLGGTTNLQFARNAAIVNATMLGSSSFNETVSELTSNGVPEKEAREYASEVAAYMSVIGAVSGAISPNKASSKIAGQEFKDQIIKNTITAYKNSGLTGASGVIKKALNGLPNALKEIGLESISETGTELGETFGQKQVNSVINEKLGERILDDKMTKDEAISIMLVSSLATLPTSVAGTSSELFGLDVKEQFNAASELNDEDLVKSVKNVVSTGQITAERGDELITQVRNYRNNKSKLPSNIKGKKAVDATQLIAERESLKQQRKNLDEVFHPEIDAKIESINNQLKGVLNQPETIEDTTGTGKSTQEFFGTVVKGGDERYTPSKSYEYEQEFTPEQDKFRKKYDDKKGNFDEHIATSIPTFRETQVKKGNAIIKMLEDVENPVVYDLGGSEGSWVKTITEESGGKIKTINLDPSPDMKEAFDKNKPENSEMSLEAFYSGWDDVPTHEPKEKADVVHESMMFQFIENKGDRKEYIDEVADKYLKEDGVFITEEKFKMNTDEEYNENEKLKESHKNKYYTPEQQSLKSDEVLVGMKENQANFDQYVKELQDRFKYVKTYWKSGNFRGIIATNNESKLNSFLENLGETSSKKYNWEKPYDKNEEEINSEEILKTTLDNGVWGMLTAEKPDAKKLSEEENIVRNSEAKKWLEEKGYKPKEIKGKYGNEENSFFVPNLSKQDAIEFARTFNQESVATNEGLVYQDGSFNPRIEGVEVGGNYEDFYSTMKIGDKDVSFQVNYNFDEKINEPNQTTTAEEVTVPNQEGKNTGDDEVLRANIESPANYKEVAVSEKSRENMTEDGEGNFVFYHYSPVQFDKLDPSKSGSNKSAITSSTETGAWSSAGGVNYLYTRDGQRERMVRGDYGYEFKVPMDKVYDTDADVNNYGEEAERRYAESHNGAKPNANVKTALITKIASENGYQVTVTSWEGTTRAQTNQPLTPNDTLVMNGTKVVKDFTKKYESNYDKKLASEERYDFDTVRDLTTHLQDKYVKSGKMENVVGIQPLAVVRRIMDADIPEAYKKLYVDLLEKEGMTGALNSIPQTTKDRLKQVVIPDNKTAEKMSTPDKAIKLINKMLDDLDKFSKGTAGINIAIPVAKAALQTVKAAIKAGKSISQAIQAGTDYVKNSSWYKNLSDSDKAEFDSKGLIRSIEEAQAKQVAETIVKSETIDNKKSTKATVRQNTGQTDTSAKVTISESKLLKEKFKNLQRGFKEGVKETNQMKRDFIEQVKSSIKGLGSFITEQDAKTILNQVANVNDKNIDKISEVIDNLVSRLENRANKAKVNKLAKMQRKAKVKARTKYGNAGGDINKLIKLPANQIPEAYFDRYFDLMQKLAKGEPVNFNEVSKLYSDLKTEIESFIDRKNNATKDKKEPDVDKVNESKSKLKGKINFAKLSTPKNKLTDFEKRVLKSFFEIPDSYLDQLSLAKLNELNKALDYFISTGYMPNKVLSDFVMKYKSEQTASNIINKVGDIVLKPVLSITGMIDKIRNKGFTSDDFFKNIQNNMLHHIDSTIKGIKGTLFYDNIVHPITSNFNKSDSETNKIGREVAEKLNAASKSEGSGFKVNVRLQMFFRQREFESNPELRGDKVFSLDDHMLSMKENENSLDYTKDDLDLIYQLYDEIKGKSSDEMLDMMTKEEKDLIDYMDKKLKEQEISSRDYNNHLLGETLIYTKDYFPRKASFTDNNADEASEIKARLFGMTGATSVKADSSNQRTANKANPLDFNSVANFMTNIRQSNIEKNLAFPVKQTLMTISNLKKSNDKSMITLANTLEKTVKNLIEAQLGKNPYSYDSKGEQLFNKFTRNSVTRMLVDPVRLIYDVIANYPTVYGAFIDKLPAIKKASSNITNEVSSEIYKNISSTQSERVGGTASSDYKNAMTTPISKTSNRKAKVSPVEALVDLYKNNKLSDFSENAGNLYYQIADLPARHLWKYYLSEEFRNITGNEFDGKKYLSDKNYREEVQESLQKAATSADKKTANYFNTGASSEQKLKIQGTKNNFLTRVNNFLRSFTFNENRVFWDSLKGMTGFGNTTFDSKSEAMRAFFVINARGITYSYLGSVIGQYLVDFVTGDDEEEKEMIDKKALKRSIGQHAALIALGNKGMIANFIGMFIGEQINARLVEEEKGKYNPYEDNMFYVPNKKSKYTDFLNNLGAEGAAIKTVVDFGSVVFNIYEKIESGEEVTKEDLVRYKTARHSVSLVSQATGLPIDRLGRLAQKALDKKYPYEKKNKPKKISDSTWGKY